MNRITWEKRRNRMRWEKKGLGRDGRRKDKNEME